MGGESRRVAIACQGGGSHTAFTAGVLTRLLGADALGASGRYDVVGLSGTSGGAICALLAWYALRKGEPERAGRLLEGFWVDNSATAPLDRFVNDFMLWASKAAQFVATPDISPYSTPIAPMAEESFRQLLRSWVDFDRIDVDREGHHPLLLIGAVDVLSGEFKAFNSRRDRINADAVLASAAIPNLFRSIGVDGGTYWDGLFSQNPPVRDLLDVGPDELWVIQINPTWRDTEPTTAVEIADRRNELAGNLSLFQELHVIEKIDSLLEQGQLVAGGKYKQVVVRVIELSRSRLSRLSQSLGAASKLNRDPAFIQRLMADGRDRAEEFLGALAFEQAWRSGDDESVLDSFADGAELVSAGPFPPPGRYRGAHELRPFVQEHLCQDVRVDLTKKQVARDRVAWTVKMSRAGAHSGAGRLEARFQAGKITSLLLSGHRAL